MWLSAVGAAVSGTDTGHTATKAHRPAPCPRQALHLSHDWRGRPGARWCVVCRWLERKSPCPGSIVPAARAFTRALAEGGQLPRRLVQLTSTRPGERVRDLPVLACTRCGATGTQRACGFKQPCGKPGPKGALALARLEHGWAPGISAKVATHAVPLTCDEAGPARGGHLRVGCHTGPSAAF